MKTEQLFWDRVATLGPDECWLWQGTINAINGYGYWVVGKNPLRAHRVAYEYKNGPIPEGQYVLHHCDVRACVNPAHLFLGSHQDNMNDMRAKGRQAKGTDQHLARLTDDAVRQIRTGSETLQYWADKFNVSVPCIAAARDGRTWKHVDAPPIERSAYRGERQHLARLDEAAVRDILTSGSDTRQMADRYGVSFQTVWRIKKGKAWKHIHQPGGRGK